MGFDLHSDGPSIPAGSQRNPEHKQAQVETHMSFVGQSNRMKSTDDPIGIKVYGTLKRRADEAFEFEAESGERKKKHVVGVTKRSAEAGVQPRRDQ